MTRVRLKVEVEVREVRGDRRDSDGGEFFFWCFYYVGRCLPTWTEQEGMRMGMYRRCITIPFNQPVSQEPAMGWKRRKEKKKMYSRPTAPDI